MWNCSRIHSQAARLSDTDRQFPEERLLWIKITAQAGGMVFSLPAFLCYITPSVLRLLSLSSSYASSSSCFLALFSHPSKISLILTLELVLISSWGCSSMSWNRSTRNAGQNTRQERRWCHSSDVSSLHNKRYTCSPHCHCTLQSDYCIHSCFYDSMDGKRKKNLAEK